MEFANGRTPTSGTSRGILVLVLGALLLAGPASAQVLTLTAAMARADSTSYAVRIAAGESAARAGQAMAPLRGVLPTVRVEGGYVKTDNPLGAFGYSLQQRSVASASFNPATLNDPAPIGNLGSALVIEQPIFNADAWLARRAAVRARDAASAAVRWSRLASATEVVRGYFGAVLAAERVTTLEAGLTAAKAHERQAESLLRNGVVTRSDALIAAVRSGQAETALLEARGGLASARRRLALVLGQPADTAWSLPDSLPDMARIERLAEALAPAGEPAPPRADLLAADLARGAAQADLTRAKSLYLPRLNAFGRLEWNTPAAPFGGTESWTVGLLLSWSPFSGGSELAEIRAARGRAAVLSAQSDAARAQAGFEAEQSRTDLQVSLARLSIAGQAVSQSAEAHRIVTRKYDGGLATVVELGDAAALETESRLACADARYQVISAAAARCQALGLDLSPFAQLDP